MTMGKNAQIRFQRFKNNLTDIYSLQNEESKGRLIFLGDALLTAMYNVFITGIFYTGFLSMYGISITGVGIVTFIPYIASCFSVFSPMILGRFKKRKGILLAAKIYFYAMYILATTVMPQFVTDPDARLAWFIILLFLAYAVYALFSPGITSWFARFYPQENKKRTRFIVLNQIFSSVLSSTMLLLSSLLTDAVAGSSMQNALILGFRYFAFVLVVVDVAMQACAKEYEYPEAPKLRLREVFTLPFKYRKFLLCMIFMFIWNFNSNLNNGLWSYHLLNHLHYSYTIINMASMSYTVILLLTSNWWEGFLRRFSWIKTFGIACMLFVPTEFMHFAMTPGMEWFYLITCLIQNVLSVPLNFSYANVLYMNLPEENATAHIAFNTIGCNLFAFLGMVTGTWIAGLTGDNTWNILGVEIYSVQFTTAARGVVMIILGYILVRFWRSFTRDEDIAEIDARNALHGRKG
jgi:MFS family permease